MLKTYIHAVAWSLLFLESLSSGIDSIADKFQQSDYKIDYEWAETVRYNNKALNCFRLVDFKYNRTCKAANLALEFKVDVGYDLELVIQAYKFASNEYRLFPLRFQVNLCYGLSKNMIGARAAYNCGCPIRKEQWYHSCNFVPDESQFPPFVLSGKYMIEAQGTVRSKEMFVLRAYGSVIRPLI